MCDGVDRDVESSACAVAGERLPPEAGPAATVASDDISSRESAMFTTGRDEKGRHGLASMRDAGPECIVGRRHKKKRATRKANERRNAGRRRIDD